LVILTHQPKLSLGFCLTTNRCYPERSDVYNYVLGMLSRIPKYCLK